VRLGYRSGENELIKALAVFLRLASYPNLEERHATFVDMFGPVRTANTLKKRLIYLNLTFTLSRPNYGRRRNSDT
jgi:hypothetical protein